MNPDEIIHAAFYATGYGEDAYQIPIDTFQPMASDSFFFGNCFYLDTRKIKEVNLRFSFFYAKCQVSFPEIFD